MLNKRNKKPNIFETLSYFRYMGSVQCSRLNNNEQVACLHIVTIHLHIVTSPSSYDTQSCVSHTVTFSHQF